MPDTKDNPKIIIASAGAGKTHKLTETYLEMLEKSYDAGNPHPHRNILAVTFTNKATDEMKERILEKLFFKAANGDHNSEKLLKEILHDYSGFNVSTIDRFFQLVMKTFARELGEYGSYDVELDSEGATIEAIDRMMDSLGDDKDKTLLKWLVDYSRSVIDEGRSWDVRKELYKFSDLFYKEDFLIKKRGEAGYLYRVDDGSGKDPKTEIKKFLKEINKITTKFENEAKVLAGNIITEYDRVNNYVVKMIVWPRNAFIKLRDGIFKDYFHIINKYYKTEEWCKSLKTNSGLIQVDDYKNNYAPGLREMVDDLKTHFDNHFITYNTAKTIRKNIYLLGLTTDIFKELDKYLKENHLVLLSSTADILNRIIDRSDTPFIYERIGNRIDHILLDEFQDTSKLQWQNFEPLIDNNIANSNDNLIVGDVKQSIYRFRGSDSSLLRNLPEIKGVTPEDIKENWRSADTIVGFNSKFFYSIATTNDGSIKPEIFEEARNIYEKCYQKMPKKSKNKGNLNRYDAGAVKVRVFEVDKEDKKAWMQEALDALAGKEDDIKDLGEIGRLTDDGYELRDITILVRTNKEGKMVVDKLISKGINVVTEEVLVLGYSRAVLKIVSLLKYRDNPDDQVNQLMLKTLFTENQESNIGDLTIKELAEMPLKEGCEAIFTALFNEDQRDNLKVLSLYENCEVMLRSIYDEIPDYEIEFVQAFLDEVNRFMSRNGSDKPAFMEWWEESGQNVKINSSSDQNAVRVMTIHKAKGLGFKAVIIPFFNEKTSVKTFPIPPYLWCIPDIDELKNIGLIPVKYTTKDNTGFEKDFETERKETYIDTLNIAYVAMTRAYFEMVIYTPDETEESDDSKKPKDSMAQKLIKFLKEESQKKDNGIYIEESQEEDKAREEKESKDEESGRYIKIKDLGNGCYEARANNGQWRYSDAKKIATEQQGATQKVKVLEKSIETTTVKSFRSIPIGDRLEQSLRSRDFFEFEKDPLESPRIKGLVLHDILSEIRTIDDLQKAVNRAVIQGDLKESERNEAMSFLSNSIKSVADRHWFDGTYETMNEQEILISNGETQRPDRILMGKDETIVIDYKFGKHDDAKYRKQVRDYMKNLEQIGLPGITGYIWYFKDNDIVQVNLNEKKTLF
ncbi:MAG TPA: UvrD-helicase domain-containing protein [Bacteroidales bacterium]|jgi:ATP-dependent helicase/nuclease subunit A|nr:UvrD-helicase domain-containing protein [Bacteroidales bacterium]HPB88912.1 UvrD-helicase domain-containing protein [Bacteroidales bacterium]HPY22232.1 UvrD-helicase domain-containing protein [Bacteroidales bacterium]HQA93413.1 UvrD-helicase domain-containing protein [Bacteroidales bacterium]HQN23741.1 UvrD-helicase domain-containing protein [Bacteroidales bacterium]